MSFSRARKELRAAANPADAIFLQRFFKTGPGEYGEGDRLIGVRVPAIRRVAKAHRDLDEASVVRLLTSPIHEERLLALLILRLQFERGTPGQQRNIYSLYLSHTTFINNWDLVDCSAEHLLGGYLFARSRRPLYRLARSKLLWERRMAIMATFHFIRRDDFHDTLQLAELLVGDEHDLMHKAVGWMLREVGNRDRAAEEAFLRKHYPVMPRTMLRYAIERFPEGLRQRYLKGRVPSA